MATPPTGDAKRNFVHDNSLSEETRGREGYVSLASDDRRPVSTIREQGRRALATSDKTLLEAVQGLQSSLDQILELLQNNLK